MKNQSDKDINQRIDNGLKKEELSKKYGATFGGNSELPPEIEKEWLRNIELFEEQFKQNKTTTVFKRLNEPDFKKIDSLKDEEIPIELDRLYTLMNDNYISLDTLCEVDDKELYRFITEELFFTEIDEIQVPGYFSCYTYEEFHPNAEYDVHMAIDYFFRFTLGKSLGMDRESYDLLYVDTENYIDLSGKNIDKETITRRINNFLKSFDSFEIIKIETLNTLINENEDDAEVQFKLEYKAWLDKESAQTHKGKATFRLHPCKYGGWSIYQIDMPGWNEAINS